MWDQGNRKKRLDELFDFYFNVECLEKNCELYDSILEHADNMIADIESYAQTTDRWLDLTVEKLYSGTILWKGDIGPIKGYRTIRPHSKWAGDRFKRMGMSTMTTYKPVFEEWFS